MGGQFATQMEINPSFNIYK